MNIQNSDHLRADPSSLATTQETNSQPPGPPSSSDLSQTSTGQPLNPPASVDEHSIPTDVSSQLLSVSAGLLAIAVGVLAFVPLILEIAIQRSVDADLALARAKRANGAFDVLLVSLLLLGLSTGLGIALLYLPWYPMYVVEAWSLALGLVSLMVGTLILGWTLRALRNR